LAPHVDFEAAVLFEMKYVKTVKDRATVSIELGSRIWSIKWCQFE